MTTHPGCIDHAPGIHQAEPMLMTVGKSSFISCPQGMTFIYLKTVDTKNCKKLHLKLHRC